MMTSQSQGAVVVGHDGSAASLTALAWAAGEAELKRCRLHIVTTREPEPSLAPDALGTDPFTADAIVDRAVATVRRTRPGLEVTAETTQGPASLVLLGASHHADTLVLGAHGHRRRELSDVGSTAWQVVSHAGCPVVIATGVPRTAGERGPVVLGVSRSRSCDAATSYAFAQAYRRRVPLMAVHGWQLTSRQAAHVVLQSDDERHLEDQAQKKELGRWLAPWQERFPEVDVDPVSQMCNPVDIILARAAHAQLVVVGRRGSGGFPGLLVGSTGFDLLRSTPSPLAIVPSEQRASLFLLDEEGRGAQGGVTSRHRRIG